MRRPPVRGSTPAGAGTLPASVPWTGVPPRHVCACAWWCDRDVGGQRAVDDVCAIGVCACGGGVEVGRTRSCVQTTHSVPKLASNQTSIYNGTPPNSPRKMQNTYEPMIAKRVSPALYATSHRLSVHLK